MGSAEPIGPAASRHPKIATSQPWAASRRNAVLLALDTAFFALALSFLDSSSVLPSLLHHLTNLPVLYGLLASMQTGCWLLPQLFVAQMVAHRRRKLPIVVAATALGRLSWLFLIAGLLATDQIGTGATLVAIYLAVGFFWMMDGVSVVPWYDMLARTVPPTLRGRLFGLLAMSSGIAAVGGGLIVERVIGSAAFPYPADYRTLAVAALVIFVIGIVPLTLVKENVGEDTPEPEPFGRYLRRLPDLLRGHGDFRRLVAIQLLVGSSAMAVPFYAPYASVGLGLPESAVGTYVIGVTLGSMTGGMAWGWLGDRGRKDFAVRAVAIFGGLAPLVPLTLHLTAPAIPATVRGLLLAIAFFCVGCGIRSSWVAYANYVMEIASAAERPVLIGLMNTLGGVLAIVPPLGGLLAGWLGYEAAFLAAALPAILGVALSVKLGTRTAETRRVPAGVG